MDKNDILDYVTETPGNTNRAVLGSMLDSFVGDEGEGSGSGLNVAEVTLVGTHGSSFGLYQEYDNDAFPYGYGGIFVYNNEFITTPEAEEIEGSTTYTLYYMGDSCVVEPSNTYESSTGNVIYNPNDNTLTITGDCTIIGYIGD